MVGTGIPQKEGKARSQFKIRESKLGIWIYPFRPANRAIEEIRAGQYGRHHLLDSLIEAFSSFTRRGRSAALAAGFIERHQAGHIFGSGWPAVGAARQIFGNLLRASGLPGF